MELTEKHELLIQYAGRFGSQAFIETCDDDASTLKAMQRSKVFAELHMIGRSWDELCSARRGLSDLRHMHFWRGDLAQHLAQLARRIRKPILFWLRDAAEGTMALNLRRANEDVILIDGFRRIKRRDFQQFKRTLSERFPDWVCEIEHDVVRCHRNDSSEEDANASQRSDD